MTKDRRDLNGLTTITQTGGVILALMSDSVTGTFQNTQCFDFVRFDCGNLVHRGGRRLLCKMVLQMRCAGGDRGYFEDALEKSNDKITHANNWGV